MKRIEITFFILATILLLANALIFTYPPLRSNAVTGNILFRAAAATVSFFVEGGLALIINIDSPENTTYNFNIGDNYSLDLNVSASEETGTWWYSLYDAKHKKYVVQNRSFSPNTTFEAVRWSNRLQVYANNTPGSKTGTSTVSFYIQVPNSAPEILDLISEGYACEGSSFSTLLNISDVDEDSLSLGLSPSNPFFIIPVFTFSIANLTRAEIFSTELDKEDVDTSQGFRIHELLVSATDRQYVDTENLNVTVIEINNPPVVEDIGVQTIWTQGDNSTFSHILNVSDIEDGIYASGNFSYNLSFLTGSRFFNIGSDGLMSFVANSSILGVYNLEVCATDTGISPISPNISLCGQTGLNQTSCDQFSITITDDNRAPVITDYYPSDYNLNVSGSTNLRFNVTSSDPDGTIPDVYWRVDNSTIERDSGSSVSSFDYSFGCGVSGEFIVRAEATDGLLNDSVEWNVSVSEVACLINQGGSGGGGGGGGQPPECLEKWGCGDWGVCQHTGLSYQSGVLSDEDYIAVKIQCSDFELNDSNCGFQIRACLDVQMCKTEYYRPDEIQACHFVSNPSCEDGVKNCHDGSCEFLIDCGGPCSACSTCSDGLQNQGEQGIDCGGPCPYRCPAEGVLPRGIPFQYVLIVPVVFLFVLIIYKIRRIRGLNKKIKK